MSDNKCSVCGNTEQDLVHNRAELRRREDSQGMDHDISDSIQCHEFQPSGPVAVNSRNRQREELYGRIAEKWFTTEPTQRETWFCRALCVTALRELDAQPGGPVAPEPCWKVSHPYWEMDGVNCPCEKCKPIAPTGGETPQPRSLTPEQIAANIGWLADKAGRYVNESDIVLGIKTALARKNSVQPESPEQWMREASERILRTFHIAPNSIEAIIAECYRPVAEAHAQELFALERIIELKGAAIDRMLESDKLQHKALRAAESSLRMVDETLARRPAIAAAPNRYAAIEMAFNEAGKVGPLTAKLRAAESALRAREERIAVLEESTTALAECGTQWANKFKVREDAVRRLCGDDIREKGWAVAVHNDYKLDGVSYTFWLFTKGNLCVKGEGRTDEEALNVVRTALAEVEAPVSRDAEGKVE